MGCAFVAPTHWVRKLKNIGVPFAVNEKIKDEHPATQEMFHESLPS